MSKNDTKFEWDATESAPKHYPMEIIQGTFLYHGEAERGLYIPSGGTLRSGWGHPISSHVVGEQYKPLPDRLQIIFFSNAERQFYKGEFALPYDKILALFRDGVTNPVVLPGGDTLPKYSRIMAGIAPGGAVAVWVIGYNKDIEIFFGQAEKIELDPGRAFALPFKSKEQADAYIEKQLVNVLTPDELESLKKNGIPFGLWARYRNRYDWVPIFAGGYQTRKPTIFYLNGESVRYFDPADKEEVNALRPVPSRMEFSSIINGRKGIFSIEFDEFETMAAFEKLAAQGQKVFLEFEPRLPETDIRIRLYNDKESIELKKFISKP